MNELLHYKPHHAAGSAARLVVAHVVEGCQGGVGSAVKHLIESQAQDEQIREVHLLCDPRRLGEMLECVPAFTHRYESTRNPLRLLAVSAALRQQLREIAPDVVFLHSTFPGVYGRLRRRTQTDPWAVVYCAHGWAFTQKISLVRKRLYTLVERGLAARTDAIVSISYSEFDAAIRAKLNPRIHRVIYHGVPAGRKAVAAPLTVDTSRLNLGFIGRFDHQKGLDLLLEAFASPQLNHIDLWLIGGSTLGREYQIPEQTNIKLVGWVPNSEIDSYVRCFDALIVPSRWEGFGLIGLEAMRNGRPVLASRTGGLAEFVIDGVNGRLFEAESAADLRSVLLDISKADLARMGKTALEIFNTGFTLRDCYLRWSALTTEVLGLRARCPRPATETPYLDTVTAHTLEEL